MSLTRQFLFFVFLIHFVPIRPCIRIEATPNLRVYLLCCSLDSTRTTRNYGLCLSLSSCYFRALCCFACSSRSPLHMLIADSFVCRRSILSKHWIPIDRVTPLVSLAVAWARTRTHVNRSNVNGSGCFAALHVCCYHERCAWRNRLCWNFSVVPWSGRCDRTECLVLVRVCAKRCWMPKYVL